LCKKINMNYWEEFEKVYIDTPDCVCNGINSYENVIKNIFSLTQDKLILKGFQCSEIGDSYYILELEINNKSFSFDFTGSDFFEIDLLEEFNSIIKLDYPNENRKLINIGNDFIIAFTEPEREYELAKSGKIWRHEDWIFKYEQINEL
jgi:hypothetical protein